MDTRQRLSVVFAAIIIGSASVSVSHANAGPEWVAATEAVAAEQKATKATPTPTHPSAPIGEDLIYDIVGPNTAP